jgi:putative transcriptional regulator
MASARTVHEARAATGLSRTAFAKRFHINPGRLRDLEQRRSKADSVMLAYLTAITREPGAVEPALGLA